MEGGGGGSRLGQNPIVAAGLHFSRQPRSFFGQGHRIVPAAPSPGFVTPICGLPGYQARSGCHFQAFGPQFALVYGSGRTRTVLAKPQPPAPGQT